MDQPKKKFDYLRFFTLITIWVFLIVLISLMTTVLKYKDLVKHDPLNYGMMVHNFTSCTCIDQEGKQWENLNDSGFVHTEFKQGTVLINISNINVSKMLNQ